MSKMLTRADIIAANDRKTEIVNVPEWDGEVCIKALSLGQIDDMRDRSEIPEFKGKFGYMMMAESMVDANGVPLFALTEIEELRNKSVAALHRCLEVCNRLNAQTPDAVAEAGNVSETTPASDLPTA